MIGVLTQKARAMMLDLQAPMQFWAEAINTTCDLHRKTPNQSLDGKTPYEVLKHHRWLYRNGNSSSVCTALGNSQRVNTAIGNSQRVSTALGNSCVSTALGDSWRVNTAIGNSQHVSTVLGNSRVGDSCVSTALDGNSQGVSMRPEQDDTTSAKDKPTLDHLWRFGCVVWKHIPKCQRMDAKMGARAKACMMLGYLHDTTKIW